MSFSITCRGITASPAWKVCRRVWLSSPDSNDWNRARIAEFAETDDLPWVLAHTENELSTKLLEFVHDRPACEAVGAKGRRFMEDCWSDRRVVSHLANFYDAL